MWNKSPLSLKSLESLGKFQFQQHLNADLECSFMEIYTDTASKKLKQEKNVISAACRQSNGFIIY